MNYAEATDRFANQLAHTESFWTRVASEQKQARVDVISDIAMIATDGFLAFYEEEPTAGQRAQTLADWHTYVEGRCSATYADLRGGLTYYTDGLERAALNRIPELVVLNGIRRGIGVAMRGAYKEAHGSNRGTSVYA